MSISCLMCKGTCVFSFSQLNGQAYGDFNGKPNIPLEYYYGHIKHQVYYGGGVMG